MPESVFVMPCYKALSYTVNAVETFFKSTQDKVGIVLIDDCSNDGTIEYFHRTKSNSDRVIEVIRHEERQGFTSSIEEGLSYAKDKYPDLLYLGILNNDLVFPSLWCDRLKNALDNMEEGSKGLFSNIAIAGPASNAVGGVQRISGIDPYNPMDYVSLSDASNKWYESNSGSWQIAGFLSGFCMMFTKELYDTLIERDGYCFDVSFTPGGFEDNDFVVRAYRYGYNAIAVLDTFVHHFGTVSTSLPELTFMKGGLHNRLKFYSKWKDTDNKPIKIVATYRVKNVERWFDETLSKTSELVDEILVLDDGSTDRTFEIAKKYDKVLYRKYDRSLLEYRDRQELLDWAIERKADWVIAIDGDEVVEDKVTREYLERLLRPVRPEVSAFIVKFATFWNGRQFIRTDSTFGGLSNVRIFRPIKGHNIRSDHPQGFHCGTAPIFPPEMIRFANIRFKHYGFEDYDLCKKKYEWYQESDTLKDPVRIGHSDYSHLIEQHDVTLSAYDPDASIDLNMVVKNEEDWLPDLLEVIAPFFDNIVIGIDNQSQDKTEDIVNFFTDNTFKFDWCDDFSIPRNLVKAKSKSKWILSLDADERISPKDIALLVRMLEKSHIDAWLFQVANLQKNGKASLSENFRMFKNVNHIYWSGYVHETIEDSLHVTGTSNVGRSPFTITHYGYLKGDTIVGAKLDRYLFMNQKSRNANPNDARPWFNEALHWLNDGDRLKGLAMLEKACELSGTYFQAHKECGIEHLRRAFIYMDRANDLLGNEHPTKDFMRWICQSIKELVGDDLVIGKPNTKG